MTELPPDPPKAGLGTAISLVVGNTIGSGVFLLPAALAVYGGISLLGWLFSFLGAISLALVFMRLSRDRPGAGGPYAFSRDAFGDFIGFQVAWGYWVSVWVGNAAIVTSAVSYLGVFFPSLKGSPIAGAATGLGIIWLLTWVNTRGIRETGLVQRVTTVLKLLPLVLVPLFGLFFMDVSHFRPFNLSDASWFGAVTATASLTLWAFLGIESATVPAGQIRDAENTIPRATLWGTLIVALVYVSGSVVIMGLIPPAALQLSQAPYADAAKILWGPAGSYIVAAGAVIASVGALNGWILVQGQVPMAAAADRVFPAFFQKTNRKGAPAAGIVLSSLLVSGLMAMNYHKSLVETFQFMLLLATASVLVPYLFCALAYLAKALSGPGGRVVLRPGAYIGFTAFLFSLWAIAGSGEEAVYWGFLLLTAGSPVYIWMKRKP
ncbi:MAG: amino acid permease [Saprospiraceae bacterium]